MLILLLTNIVFTKGVREARDGIDSRYRFAGDDSSRFGSSRDRQGMERHFADQAISQVSFHNFNVENM